MHLNISPVRSLKKLVHVATYLRPTASWHLLHKWWEQFTYRRLEPCSHPRSTRQTFHSIQTWCRQEFAIKHGYRLYLFHYYSEFLTETDLDMQEIEIGPHTQKSIIEIRDNIHQINIKNSVTHENCVQPPPFLHMDVINGWPLMNGK